MHGPLTVLKFGGSVLTDDAALRRAAFEVHRERRRGRRVVAVVSALAGATDRLAARLGTGEVRTGGHAAAAWLALGEADAVARFGLELDAVGIAATVLDAGGLGLIAAGDPRDADPVRCDPGAVERGLARDGVVVVPGFVAVDERGRQVVLGRGGSDLTAIVLGVRLDAARIDLVKDVDGLYERDPAAAGPRPRRYTTATIADALATDGSILQTKALLHARAHGRAFHVRPFGDHPGTLVGAPVSRFDPDDVPDRPSPRRVALLGFGAVGRAVFRTLVALRLPVEVASIAVRDPERAIAAGAPPDLVTTDAVGAAADDDVDVVVELIGGTDAAAAAWHAAARRGVPVVTANKALLAACPALWTAEVWCAAAVGGIAPVLETASRLAEFGEVTRVRGILNGTSNAVLTALATGVDLGAALAAARAGGLAEADSGRDLDGRDAADKLAVLAAALGAGPLDPAGVGREPIDVQRADLAGRRQVATLELDGPHVRASVALERLGPRDPLVSVDGPWNAAVFETARGDRHVVRGRGAGGLPTAFAVLADLEAAIAGPRRRRPGGIPTARA